MATLFFLSSLVWLSVVSGDFLTYDHEGQQLHFQCPRPGSVPSHPLLNVLVTRVPKQGGNATVLAEWKFSGGQGTVRSLQDRIQVPDGPTDYLDATLEHVNCHDSRVYDYFCVTQIDDDAHIASKEYKQQFQFIGDISQPAITQTPLKSRYNAGELLSLKCTAFIGTEDNGVVWEAGFEEGSFSPVTGEEENPATGKAYEEEQEDLPDCTRQSHFPLKYRVKAEDDGKIFQCRLRRTEQTTRIVIAVKTGKEKCANGVRNSQEAVERQVTEPRSGQLVERDAEGGALSSSHLFIVIIAILAAMVIVAVLGFFVLRHWKKKQLPPLVVVETPASSESGYTDRRLPNPPYLDTAAAGTSHPPRENTTIPKWIADTHLPHLENNLNNRNNNGSHPDIASASVYVSMTAVDRCGEPPLQAGGSDVTQDGRALAETGDMVPPDMGRDRSESLYSNQEAVKKENPGKVAAAADAPAASACIEKLKAGAENAIVPKDDDDDKSVYVPSFVESI